jgi:hypothetical protein
MATQWIASGVSEGNHEGGQNNRSGPNFRFLSVPSSGDISVLLQGAAVTGTTPTAILVEDRGGKTDIDIAAIETGTTFPASRVKTDQDYYLATPTDFVGKFVAVFQGNV